MQVQGRKNVEPEERVPGREFLRVPQLRKEDSLFLMSLFMIPAGSICNFIDSVISKL